MRRHEEELVKIEQDIAFWQREIGESRERAARLLADDRGDPQGIMRWLTARGLSYPDARELCLRILYERRAARS